MALAAPLSAGEIPYARDLEADAEEAEARVVPILVMFSSESCPYCQRVMDEYILPMAADPAYREKVIIRVVELEGALSLVDFEGERMGHAEFADAQGVTLTPAIKFYDYTGAELVPELIGFSSEDFYGYYLEAKIDRSLTKLRSRVRVTNAAPSV